MNVLLLLERQGASKAPVEGGEDHAVSDGEV
jgi:hypothetical protein